MTAATDLTPRTLRELPRLVSLAVPLILGLSASTLLGVTDTLIIAPLGATALAAVGLTVNVALVFYAAIYGLVSVVGVKVAEAHGARAPRRISAELRSGLVLGFLAGGAGAALMWAILPLLDLLGQPPQVLTIIGPYWALMSLTLVPFTVLTVLKQFFEAVDRAWTGMAFAFLGVALNIPVTIGLVHGVGPLPAMGLVGAGIGTFAAEALALVAALAYWRRARSMRRMRLRARVAAPALWATTREGAPLGLMYAAETAALAFAGLMLGWIGAVALAANQVVFSVGSLLYMLPLGMAGAVAIRVGQALGEGRTDRLRPIGIAALGLVTVWTVAATALLIVFGGAIAAAISDDAAVVALATSLFGIIAAMQVFDGLQSTALGALRGMHDTVWPSAASFVAYWLIAIPAGWALAFPLGFGAEGVWLGFLFGLSTVAVALPIRFWRRTAGG